MRSSGQVTLVGINNAVDQNKWSPSVAVPLDVGETVFGAFIKAVRLITGESGDGSVIKSVGDVVFFNADPAIASNDAAITAAEWLTVVGHATFAAANYTTGDALGAVAQANVEIPLSGGSLWAALFKTDAAAVNDAADNNEFLYLEVMYTKGL